MYGKRLNSGGTDSQIFIAENLNISVRAYERAFISLDKNIVGKKLEFLRWAEIKKLHIFPVMTVASKWVSNKIALKKIVTCFVLV